VKISAHHGGGMLTVMVEDDGRGIDVGALKEKVVAREFAAQSMADKMTDSELVEFLFLPDFSTRDSVSEISGRGVGLDVVHSMIAEMHGSVRIENRQGQGVKFILQMPVTLSVLTAIVVMVGDEYYAFPLSRIERLESVGFEKIRTVNKEQYVTVNERDIRIISAAQVLELGAGNSSGEQLNIVVVKKGDHSYGVVVDSFLGQRELSVQALDARLGKIQDISAAALMEDGSPVLIVDVDDLLRSVEILISGGFASSFARQANPNDGIKRKRILVVDDSLTVREVEKKLLVDQGYQVDIAVDGMDGWNAIRRSDYDLLITDVDMPRMDGIELVELLKQDHRLEALPVMIVSYKDRREDRQRGLEAGADYYLSKGSFHDETLIEAVIDLIGEARE
jgi:two-component system sensor histidine kinase and response regulator WspE